jgi:hypothetical protein
VCVEPPIGIEPGAPRLPGRSPGLRDYEPDQWGFTNADGCCLAMFPQVTAPWNVGLCHGELTSLGLFVPTRIYPRPVMRLTPRCSNFHGQCVAATPGFDMTSARRKEVCFRLTSQLSKASRKLRHRGVHLRGPGSAATKDPVNRPNARNSPLAWQT